MKEYIKMIAVLTVTCLVSGSLLAWVNKVTEPLIDRVKRVDQAQAIKMVLPECENDPIITVCVIEEQGKKWEFFVGRLGDEFSGCAVRVESPNGYGGPVVIMLGINAAGEINMIEIMDHKETPGLGAKISDKGFTGQFNGLEIAGSDLKVTKDGGTINAITAATISSRAVAEAVSSGLAVYLKHETKIKDYNSQ